MRRVSFLIALTLVIFGCGNLAGGRAQDKDDHVAWVASSLREMQTIKVGMTRADLLKVFAEEGGLSTRLSRQYVYQKCPYFKVKVEFEAVGEPDAHSMESSQDKIVKLSQPFILEWSVID